MLQSLEQTFDQNGKVVFKTPSPYMTADPETIESVITALESNSPSLLLINFYTQNDAGSMGDDHSEAGTPIKLIVNDEKNFNRILKALKTNTHLIELSLCGYQITDEQAKELSEVFPTCPSLQKLNLYRAKVSESAKHLLNQSTSKHQEFLKQNRTLAEKFLLLEALKIICPDPKREQYKLRFKRQVSREEWGQLSQRIDNAKQAIQKKPEKEKNAAIASLFEEMMAIVDALKKQNFNGWPDLLHEVNRAKADFYLKSCQDELLFHLYGDYFIQHRDPKIDFKYAKKILAAEHTIGNGEFLSKTGPLIMLLGLFENRLRYEYFIERLENNQDPKAIKLCQRYRKKLNDEILKSTPKRKKKLQETVTSQENTFTDSKKQTTKNSEITNEKSEVEKKVSLKYTLAQNLGYGVYEDIFKGSSGAYSNTSILPGSITWNHSRIASARRLAHISSDLTYDQMVKILQIEYAALPDDDKKANASFFSLRYRTLEKALETVFQKEGILPLDRTIPEINENTSENTSLAFAILQWIGDQERSFYYKTSKNQELFFAIQILGGLAHKMVVCDKPKAFTGLKNKAEKELNKISSLVDVTLLREKLQSNSEKNESLKPLH